ncbi:hypothetical protein [Streptomyces sp. NPDC002785]
MNTHQPYDQYRYQEVLVSPMYLAGSNGTGEAGFAPVGGRAGAAPLIVS